MNNKRQRGEFSNGSNPLIYSIYRNSFAAIVYYRASWLRFQNGARCTVFGARRGWEEARHPLSPPPLPAWIIGLWSAKINVGWLRYLPSNRAKTNIHRGLWKYLSLPPWNVNHFLLLPLFLIVIRLTIDRGGNRCCLSSITSSTMISSSSFPAFPLWRTRFLGKKKVFTRVVINIFLKRGCFSNKFSKFFSPSGFDKLGSCIVGGKTGMRCWKFLSGFGWFYLKKRLMIFFAVNKLISHCFLK